MTSTQKAKQIKISNESNYPGCTGQEELTVLYHSLHGSAVNNVHIMKVIRVQNRNVTPNYDVTAMEK